MKVPAPIGDRPLGEARPEPVAIAYLSSTLAPSASSLALSFSASAFGTPSLTAFGARLDQVLGLLEAEAGDLAHRLDDVDLLVAGAGEDDGELVLHLDRSGSSGAGSGGDRDRSGGADAPLLFEQLAELSGLEDRQGRELLDQLFQISHCLLLDIPNFVET